MVITRIPFRTQCRAAAAMFLEDYAASVTEPVKLQVYPGRPRSINPPTGFVDSIRESFEYSNVTWRTRTATVEVVVLWGIFDSKVAVDQADAFADGFLDWATDRVHGAGANTTIAVVGIEDEPTYVPDWLPPAEQRTYYASRITLEGFAGG